MKHNPTESKKKKSRTERAKLCMVYSGKTSDSTFEMWLAVIFAHQCEWSFEDSHAVEPEDLALI